MLDQQNEDADENGNKQGNGGQTTKRTLNNIDNISLKILDANNPNADIISDEDSIIGGG